MVNERLLPRFILGMIVVLLLSSFSGCVGSQTGSYKDSATQGVDEAKAKCPDYLAGIGARDTVMDTLCSDVKTIVKQDKQLGAAPTPTVAAGDAGKTGGNTAFDKDVVYKEIYRDTPERSSILSTSIGAKGEDVFLKMLLTEDYDLNKYPITIDAGAMDSNSGALRFEFLVNESAVKVFERPLAKMGKWGEPQETQKYSAELSHSGKEISVKFNGMYHLIKQENAGNAVDVHLNVEKLSGWVDSNINDII